MTTKQKHQIKEKSITYVTILYWKLYPKIRNADYVLDQAFDVVAVLDGTVTECKTR